MRGKSEAKNGRAKNGEAKKRNSLIAARSFEACPV